MSVTNVYHKSREASFTLNFSATENNLSWAFTPENDGEIYDVVLNNVASYTVAGAAITLPYSLTGASSYGVSIVKTTNGQSASITFKTRRALNKSTNISVPDFGDNSINRMFILSRDGYVFVVDKTKITTSNYQGGGTYYDNPIINTLTLPTLPDYIDWGWCNIFFDGGYMYCIGMTNKRIDIRNIHICRIHVNTMTITDLDNTINSTTILLDNESDINRTFLSRFGTFDFVNRKYFFNRNDSKGLLLDLNTRVISSTVLAPTTFGSNISTGKFYIGYYDYVNDLIITRHVGSDGITSSRAINQIQDNYLFHSNTLTVPKHSTYWGRIQGFSQDGYLSFQIAFIDVGGAPTGMTGIGDLFFIHDNTRVRIQGFSQYSHINISNLHPSQSHMIMGLPFDENGTLFCTLSDVGRLHFFIYDQSLNTTIEQYLDLSNINAHCMAYDNNLIC